jgi:plastocyanin
VRPILAILAVIAALGLHLGGAATTSVTMLESSFYSPATGTRVVTIPVGDTVTWQNDSVQYHDVTFDTVPWESGQVGPGGSWSYTFNTPGIYDYTCQLHLDEGMTGRAVVVGAHHVAVPFATR